MAKREDSLKVGQKTCLVTMCATIDIVILIDRIKIVLSSYSVRIRNFRMLKR